MKKKILIKAKTITEKVDGKHGQALPAHQPAEGGTRGDKSGDQQGINR